MKGRGKKPVTTRRKDKPPSFAYDEPPKSPDYKYQFIDRPSFGQESTNTNASFVPPLESTLSDTVFVESPKQRIKSISFGSLEDLEDKKLIKNENLKKQKNKRIKKFILIFGFLIFLILLLLGGTLLILGLVTKESNNNFCNEFNVTDDQVRQSLVDNFDNANLNNGVISFRSTTEILCLPESSFSFFNETQKEILKTSFRLDFLQTEIFKIHPKAFEEDLVSQITDLIFFNNSLVQLPDNVFNSFKSIELLGFVRNPIVTLNNNLFGENSTLFLLALNELTELTSFPEFMRETPEMREIQMLQATSLVNSNSVAFEGLNKLTLLQITNAPVLEVGLTQLALNLGIDVSILQ